MAGECSSGDADNTDTPRGINSFNVMMLCMTFLSVYGHKLDQCG